MAKLVGRFRSGNIDTWDAVSRRSRRRDARKIWKFLDQAERKINPHLLSIMETQAVSRLSELWWRFREDPRGERPVVKVKTNLDSLGVKWIGEK